MKLSKKSLETIIRSAIDMEGESHFIFHVLESLKNNFLDIEGYERTEWIEFDSSNPETFPKNNRMVLAYGFPDPDEDRSIRMTFLAWMEEPGVFSSQECSNSEVHYWRSYSRPPVGDYNIIF